MFFFRYELIFSSLHPRLSFIRKYTIVKIMMNRLRGGLRCFILPPSYFSLIFLVEYLSNNGRCFHTPYSDIFHRFDTSKIYTHATKIQPIYNSFGSIIFYPIFHFIILPGSNLNYYFIVIRSKKYVKYFIRSYLFISS